MKLLIQGWINIPHSYAIVNCFQLVHLYKNYVVKEELELYIEEMEYFREYWVKKLVYPEKYNNIIKNFKKWNGEDIDIIYSITYQYDLTQINENIPKCVFYTSEFAILDQNYFCMRNDGHKYGFSSTNDVKIYLDNNKNISFVCPSEWSKLGLQKIGVEESRNKIITHGVDTSIFKLNSTQKTRNAIRNKYNISTDDILMINIGSMTGNKGMLQTFIVLNHLIKNGEKNYKLLLKGSGDLYESQLFLENYINTLRENNLFASDTDEDNLKKNIIFINNTLGYSRINDLFNAADLYISPYLAEGFNLTVLEALSSGLPVLVPTTGSTFEYINDISKCFSDYIIKLNSSVVTTPPPDNKSQNTYELADLYNTLINNKDKINHMKNGRYDKFNELSKFIEKNYSWNTVSKLLYNHLKFLIS